MHNLRVVCKIAGTALAALVAIVPVAAQGPGLAMLAGLQRGNWELHLRDDGSTTSICVRTGQEFIQLRHRQPACERFIVQDEPGEVTVQYTCRGNGYGRTTVRRESESLVQIRSQGIQGGRPFSIEGEARRTGAC